MGPGPFFREKDFPLFEQALRNIDDIFRRECGCATELDFTEQTSRLLILKLKNMGTLPVLPE